MVIKIGNNITGYEVVMQKTDSIPTEKATNNIDLQTQTESIPANVVQMHERVERPEMLLGSTYKIKTPLSDHALYVTINDMILNPDTPYEKRRPFEIFINSKNMDHFQWIVALTRIISAVFRKGGDATFLVEELRSVFDPQGGYFKRGGKYTPSLVAEIGDAIDAHMRMIGMIRDDELDPQQQKMIDEKRRELEGRSRSVSIPSENVTEDQTFPKSAQLCQECQTKAIVLLDGCMTCLSCGNSKCG